MHHTFLVVLFPPSGVSHCTISTIIAHRKFTNYFQTKDDDLNLEKPKTKY